MPNPDPLDPTESVVVQASAGTGKTWLLTSRLMRLLISGTAPASILAITFTRQAAAEMQQRINQRLLEFAISPTHELDNALEALGFKPDNRLRDSASNLYESLLAAISPFRIMTFHAFSQELLHRFPFETGIPPGFDLCEQTNEIEWAAWDALERELTLQPMGPTAQAMDVLLRGVGGLHAARLGLLTFLRHRSDWWAYTEDQPDPVSYATEQVARQLQIDVAASRNALLSDATVRSNLARYAELLQRHPNPTNTATARNLHTVLTGTGDVLDVMTTVFLTREGQPRLLRTGATLTKRLGAADAALLEQLHASLTQRIQAAAQAQRRQATFALSRAWYVCGTCLLDHYQRLKREQDLLDFADLEWLAYRLLTTDGHAEWVQYKLDQRIDHLLVDEFQDTNPTQWRLLQPLLSELTAGDPERTRSVFLVGDAKQSIYRFRRAEPQLFDAARDWLTHHANAGLVTQDISWRSSPAILNFVDLLFGSGDDAAPYALPGYRPHGARHTDLWGRAELLPLVRRERIENDAVIFRDPLTTPRVLDEDERHYREGQQVAAKITELLGRPIGTGGRPLNYGDVIILLRDRTHAPDYELALRRAGIPYAGADRGNLVNCLEVRDLIQLLTLLLVPDDNLALASVLRSPLFDASHDDLQRLAHMQPDAAWYDRLLTLSAPNGGALARAQRLLPRWREAVDRVPVHDLLDRIYCEGDVLARYESAAPTHLKDRVTTQLNRLLVLALDTDSGRFPGLARFIERLPALTADDYETGPSADAGNRVRLMTIHAAKGLEAPVVFLVNAAQGAGNRDRGPRALIEWPANEPRPGAFHFIGRKDDIDDVSAEILNRIDTANRREDSNLLYVALTRAQQVLYISGCEPGRDSRESRGWYGFIESRLAASVRDGRASDAAPTLTELTDDAGEIVNVCGYLEHGTPPPLMAPRHEAAVSACDIDPALTRPLPAQRSTPTSMQPSRHVAPDDDTATPEGNALRETAARRGAVIHRALERLSAADPADAQVRAKMWQEWAGQISVDEFDAYWAEARAVLDEPELQHFFDAATYQQARNETPILYATDGGTVYGIVDRLVWRNDEILLLDYKTHRITRAETAALAARFEAQLRLYAEGIKRLWPGKTVRPFLIFTACRQAVELTR